MFILNKNRLIQELEAELHKKQNELNDLKLNFNNLVTEDRKRIDLLLKDIEEKFNAYIERLGNANVLIESNTKFIECNVYSEKDFVEPKIIEYGEIKIEPLRLKFIKGKSFDLKGKVEDVED